MPTARRGALALLSLLLLGMGPAGCDLEALEPRHPLFRFEAPLGLLTGQPDVEFVLRVPPRARLADLSVFVDGVPLPASDLQRGRGNRVTGVVSAQGEGPHQLEARLELSVLGGLELGLYAETSFESVSLDRPGLCEVLNDAVCLYPFPSSRYLEPARTPTGYRVALPKPAMPPVVVEKVSEDPFLNLLLGDRLPLDPGPYNENDGFSPTVQILMHFPGGVDLVGSDAPRLLPETRTFDERSLDPDSPTLLIDAHSLERVAHFVENDVRACQDREPDPCLGELAARRATILRPARSLDPGHRYIVAVRGLVHEDGTPLAAEPTFAALRDRRPSDIGSLEERRARFEDVFRRLRRAGVAREELILAFDFVVQSDRRLTQEMLSMRAQGFDFLAESGGSFTVDEVIPVNPGCQDPTRAVWKEVRGSFAVPLFLETDPFLEPGTPGRLQLDEDGVPFWTTTTQAPYGIAIPCRARAGTPSRPLVVGHGLFGTGPGTVSSLANAPALSEVGYVAAGTNWSGLSDPDIEGSFDSPEGLRVFFESFLGQVNIDFDQFPAMADRLRQGQLNTLVLARMLAQGTFNSHPEFRGESGLGVIEPGEAFYFGASLGGIMGIMFAALTPDVTRLNVDVPAINFSMLLQRATPFLPFDFFFALLDPDPNTNLITLGLLHERWVRGESAGYATHVTRNPLPETPAKHVLMTVALYDQQVANLGSQVAGATLGLENLEGSVMRDLPLIPDARGPLDSAYVVYDTGSFDPGNPDHQPFIPPLANLQAQPNGCDPHGRRGFIPASVEQLLAFLQPGGVVENFCNGLCDAAEPLEIPFGDEAPCDPLSP